MVYTDLQSLGFRVPRIEGSLFQGLHGGQDYMSAGGKITGAPNLRNLAVAVSHNREGLRDPSKGLMKGCSKIAQLFWMSYATYSFIDQG